MVFLGKRSFICLLSAASIVRATIAQIETQLDMVINDSMNWEQLLDEFPSTTGASVPEALVRASYFLCLSTHLTQNKAIHSAAASFSESLSTMATVTTVGLLYATSTIFIG